MKRLTASEARLASLVANGLNDSQVAARLSLDPAAIGGRLADVYRKLGVRSRAELALLIGIHEERQVSKEAGKLGSSLYDRLGGLQSIQHVVDELIGRCAADARINQKFARTDIARLRGMLIDQVCAATGGPCTYAGRDMKSAHQGMGVTVGEFNALVEDLVASLGHLSVGQAERNELLAALGPMKADIVEVESDETGTTLPATYRAAGSL